MEAYEELRFVVWKLSSIMHFHDYVTVFIGLISVLESKSYLSSLQSIAITNSNVSRSFYSPEGTVLYLPRLPCIIRSRCSGRLVLDYVTSFRSHITPLNLTDKSTGQSSVYLISSAYQDSGHILQFLYNIATQSIALSPVNDLKPLCV